MNNEGIPENEIDELIENIQNERNGIAEPVAIEEPKQFTVTDMEQVIKRTTELTEAIEKLQGINNELRARLQESETKYNQVIKENIQGMTIHSHLSGEDSNEISVPIKFKFASPALRVEHTKMLIEQAEGIKAIRNKYEFDSWSHKTITELTLDEQLVYNKMQLELYQLDDKNQTEFFKKIIDDKQNPEIEKGYLRSSINSEFYQNINKQELVLAIYSFRIHHNI